MGKLTTRQAIRLATKKKKGKKGKDYSKIADGDKYKRNNSKELSPTPDLSPPKIENPIDLNTCNDSDNYGIDDDFLIVSSSKVDLKQPLSVKEQRFLGLYLLGNHSQIKSMKLAGYEQKNGQYLQFLARQIIMRYECQAGDHRKIMRALGWGEVEVLRSLIEAATEFKSETVRLNARESLAKCLGIQKDVLEHAEGIQIIINQGAPPDEDRPAALTLEPMDSAPPPPQKPLSITK